MKKVGAALAAMTLVAGAQPAVAQDTGEGRWSFTVTPRYQKLFFLPSFEADGLESMDSFGVSVAARSPGSRFGIMGTYMRGSGSGVYTFDDDDFTGDYDYEADREEVALTGEYMPAETNVALLAGYHRFVAEENEVLLNPASPDDFEENESRFSVDAFELGVRLTSALGANSRHSISAQFTAGIGRGSYRAQLNERFEGETTVTTIRESGTGYIGDVALGYNVFLTNNLAFGVRARGYVWYVDVDGVDPIFAVAPEANFSLRF